MLCDKTITNSNVRGGNNLFSAGISLVLGLMMILPAVGWAQATTGDRSRNQPQRVHRKSNIDNQVERLTKRLELTPQQQFSVRRILEHHREQIAQVWDDATIEPIARTYKLRDLQDETVKQIRAVLSEEQRTKYMSTPDRKSADSPTLEKNYNKYVGAR